MSLDQTECGDGAVVEPQRDVRVIVIISSMGS
jgi:hypothetical protein